MLRRHAGGGRRQARPGQAGRHRAAVRAASRPRTDAVRPQAQRASVPSRPRASSPPSCLSATLPSRPSRQPPRTSHLQTSATRAATPGRCRARRSRSKLDTESGRHPPGLRHPERDGVLPSGESAWRPGAPSLCVARTRAISTLARRHAETLLTTRTWVRGPRWRFGVCRAGLDGADSQSRPLEGAVQSPGLEEPWLSGTPRRAGSATRCTSSSRRRA